MSMIAASEGMKFLKDNPKISMVITAIIGLVIIVGLVLVYRFWKSSPMSSMMDFMNPQNIMGMFSSKKAGSVFKSVGKGTSSVFKNKKWNKLF